MDLIPKTVTFTSEAQDGSYGEIFAILGMADNFLVATRLKPNSQLLSLH
jgi:hypothetical protein